MSDKNSPWQAPPKPSASRTLVWWAMIAAGIAAVAMLWRMFPNALADYNSQGNLIWMSMILLLMGSSFIYARRFTARETLRNIALWCGIVAVLVFGYVFYHQFQDAALDLRTAAVPGYPAEAGPDRIVFSENEQGDFTAIGKVNGATVEFLIDTGASDIVLSPADAKRAGIDPGALRFGRVFETANGEGRGAPATVDRLEIGPVTLNDVQVTVNGAPMRNSLLGMAFLKRMKSFEMKGRKLTLRWR